MEGVGGRCDARQDEKMTDLCMTNRCRMHMCSIEVCMQGVQGVQGTRAAVRVLEGCVGMCMY
jgi:hypothetical protein